MKEFFKKTFKFIKDEKKRKLTSKLLLIIITTLFLIGLLIYVGTTDEFIYTVLALISLNTWILADTSKNIDVEELKEEINLLKHDIKKLKKQKYFRNKKGGKK